MRKIYRDIASALIFSNDGKLLMGKKSPNSGGVYLDSWHIPGGGKDDGETLQEAVIREVKEEVGLDISSYELVELPFSDSGVSEKTLKDTGEKVICNMNFNRFRVDLDTNSDKIHLSLNDDLVEVKWFTVKELKTVKLVPGGRNFLEKINVI